MNMEDPLLCVVAVRTKLCFERNFRRVRRHSVSEPQGERHMILKDILGPFRSLERTRQRTELELSRRLAG